MASYQSGNNAVQSNNKMALAVTQIKREWIIGAEAAKLNIRKN